MSVHPQSSSKNIPPLRNTQGGGVLEHVNNGASHSMWMIQEEPTVYETSIEDGSFEGNSSKSSIDASDIAAAAAAAADDDDEFEEEPKLDKSLNLSNLAGLSSKFDDSIRATDLDPINEMEQQQHGNNHQRSRVSFGANTIQMPEWDKSLNLSNLAGSSSKFDDSIRATDLDPINEMEQHQHGNNHRRSRVSFGTSNTIKMPEWNKSLNVSNLAGSSSKFDDDSFQVMDLVGLENSSTDNLGIHHKSKGFRTTFANTKSILVDRNPTEMKMERIEAFLYNHGMEIALGVLFLNLNLLVAGHGAYQFTEAGGWTTENDILRVTLPIARAGGRLVTLNCAILLLTACKYLWTMVRTYVAPVIPIGFPIDEVMPKYHRVVALTIIFSGCVLHTLPQIVNYASLAIMMDHKGIRGWTMGNGFATKQLLLTGTLLTIIFSTFFLTTLKAFRKTAAGFRWFWMFHVGGIATAYPLLIMHGTCRGNPIFLQFASLPLILYLFDLSMRRKNIKSANILRWRVHDDDGQQITEVVLERPKDFSYTPGQYAELKFFPISTREWHPFTIASSPGEGETRNNEIVFYIKNVGRWTEALMNFASAYDLSKAKTPTQILIRGPHGAPAMNYADYKHITVIGSGVGVTPLISIWNYLLDKEKASSRDLRKTGMASKKNARMMMSQSMNIYTESINIFKDPQRSRKFIMDFSKSMTQSFDVDVLEIGKSTQSLFSTTNAFGKWHKTCIFLAKCLDSMMWRMFFFVLFVFGFSATVILHIAGRNLTANIIASSLSLITFVVHVSNIIVRTFALGWSYFRLFKCWLEFIIIFVNCFVVWYSIKGCMTARGQIDVDASDFTAIVISYAAVIVLQAVHIFHHFYLHLKVQKYPAKDNNDREGKSSSPKISDKEQFYSVNGIVINQKYSKMKFAARAILPPILQEGLSDVFSMEFYGTREKPKKEESKKTTEHSMIGRMIESVGANIDVQGCVYYARQALLEEPQDNFFCPGRPDWHTIFLKAISNAHVTSDGGGECVGVFFCGSPAIAKDLNVVSKIVTAQHQFAMKSLEGKSCNCKLIVHSENF